MDKDNLNKDNEWLKFLETGKVATPYLKKKLKPRPKTVHVSPKQRRIFNGGYHNDS